MRGHYIYNVCITGNCILPTEIIRVKPVSKSGMITICPIPYLVRGITANNFRAAGGVCDYDACRLTTRDTNKCCLDQLDLAIILLVVPNA